MFNLCVSGGCAHPLPCPVHRVVREGVCIPVPGWEWLTEPAGGAHPAQVIITLFDSGGHWRASQAADTVDPASLDRARTAMLRDAGLLERPAGVSK